MLDKMDKKKIASIVIGCLFLGATIGFFAGKSSKEKIVWSTEEAISRGAFYLVNKIKADGSFTYRENTNPRIKVKTKYNVLRHLGTMYSLNMVNEFKPGLVHFDHLKSTAEWIMKNTYEDIDKDKAAFWTSEKISHSKGAKKQIKLGALGLGLIALCPIQNALGDEIISIEQLKKVGNTILFMQKEDGSFFSKMYERNVMEEKWTSLYYPGEAAFGLVELFKLTDEIKYLEGAIKTLKYLHVRRKRQKLSKVEPDHWALIATSKVLEIEVKKRDLNKEKGWLIEHATKVMNRILADQIADTHPAMLQFNHGFHKKGNTTPTSTRLEGLLAMYPFIEGVYKQNVGKSITQAINWLKEAQLKEGFHKGAWTRSVAKFKGKKRWIKKHNKRAGEIRIDYVQHAISALITAQNHGL
jgi:hypothetical protein